MRLSLSCSLGLLTLAVTAEPGLAQNLKQTQRTIRERVLTEAGSSDLIYSRVDFNNCAVTIQARTPKSADGKETRTTYLFHATSLIDTTKPSGTSVPLISAGGRSLRRVTQSIAAVVTESVSMESRIELTFGQPDAAVAVARAFNRLVVLCRKENPFRTAAR